MSACGNGCSALSHAVATSSHGDVDAVLGNVHSIETCGSVDGPGLRYVVFLSGCPLRCAYCHNPDTQGRPKAQLRTAEDVVADVLRYRNFIRHGGLTISGGEPLMQPAFIREVFSQVKQAGIHTALDTSGYLGARADDALLDVTDLVLLDIKGWQPQLYKAVTGVELAPTLAFAKRLEARGLPMWVRFVLVPGLTDGEANIRGLAGFVASLNNVERVEILPFHKHGEAKHRQMRVSYTLYDTPAAGPADVERAQQIFAEEGVTAL